MIAVIIVFALLALLVAIEPDHKNPPPPENRNR